ncbi:probable carboxylesterase NlhH [Coccomyxa sp. Obi]|nr:probable carboxylesterase NlhH [Coccomyxa sp. Obi]
MRTHPDTLWMHVQVYLLRAVGWAISLVFHLSGSSKTSLTLQARFHPEREPLRCEVYLPEAYITTETQPFPAYLNLHGGAFIAGDPADDGEFCRHIARKCNCVVVSLGYSLAPEHQFPAAIHDAAAAVAWLKGDTCPLRIDPGRLALGDFSAGANIAAAAAQLVPGEVSALVNFYSVSDLSRPAVDWIGRLARLAYIPQGCDLKDPLLSPLRAAPEALPDIVISIIAGIDPSRDDNLALAHALEGNRSKRSVWQHYEGVHHGWTHVPGWAPVANEEKKWEAYDIVAAELSRAWVL